MFLFKSHETDKVDNDNGNGNVDIYLAGNDQIRTNLFQPPSDWLLVCRLCSVIGGSQLFHNTRCLCTKFSVAAVYFSKTVYLHFVSWREWKIIFRFSMLLQYQWIRIRVKRRTFKGEVIWNIDIRPWVYMKDVGKRKVQLQFLSVLLHSISKALCSLFSGWQKVKMCLVPWFYTENCLSMFKCA